jgi:hypothetical protein
LGDSRNFFHARKARIGGERKESRPSKLNITSAIYSVEGRKSNGSGTAGAVLSLPKLIKILLS